MPVDENNRPHAAIGHIWMNVADVEAATEYFVSLGLRYITQNENVGILELRGGTHLVLRSVDEDVASARDAPFDLMVDDVDETHSNYADNGFDVSELETGRVHRWFELTTPDGYVITVTSSHASDHPV